MPVREVECDLGHPQALFQNGFCRGREKDPTRVRIASRNFVTGCLTGDVIGEARSFRVWLFLSVVRQRAV